MKTQNYDIASFLREEAEAEEQKRKTFAMLLGQHRQQADRAFALKTTMGGNVDSYITSMPLSWVIDKVALAGECPLFEEHLTDKAMAINKNAVSMHQQVDWRRQTAMATYLLEKENPQFPPLLVTAYQNWAYKTPLESDIWGPDGRAMRPSLYAYSLDSSGYFLDVIDEDTRYFVLDGQHRLLALRGLKTLLDYGNLPAFDKTGKMKKTGGVALDKILESIIAREKNAGNGGANKSEIREQLKGRLSETIGVEVIPAVQKNETREEATARLRQIFADLH